MSRRASPRSSGAELNADGLPGSPSSAFSTAAFSEPPSSPDAGKTDKGPRVMSVDDLRALDSELHALVDAACGAGKKRTERPTNLAVTVLVNWVAVRQTVTNYKQLQPGISVANLLGRQSHLWAFGFCNVDRRDDSGSLHLDGILRPHWRSLYYLLLAIVHRKITRPDFNDELGFPVPDGASEEDCPAVLRAIKGKYRSRLDRGLQINTGAFISSDKWSKIQSALDVWADHAPDHWREMLARHAAGNPCTDREMFEWLATMPLVGNFLGWQIAQDLVMHSGGVVVKDPDFVQLGPGASKGLAMFGMQNRFWDLLKKCNRDLAKLKMERWQRKDEDGTREVVPFVLSATELEHVLCEIQKYVRVVSRGPVPDGTKFKSGTKVPVKPKLAREFREHYGIDDSAAPPKGKKRKASVVDSDAESEDTLVATPSRTKRQRRMLKKDLKKELHVTTKGDRTRPPAFKQSPSKIVAKEAANEDGIYEVETIVKTRVRRGVREFYIKWLGYNDDTWEPEDHLGGCGRMLRAFKQEHGLC
ncbi:hypothetical protein DFJ74DRAFT_645181 [Hyaloraphidium curvatum]|nr:hypothetical protein DFJ74DRAFT_645181 [Hyaloraphidium curvatum]